MIISYGITFTRTVKNKTMEKTPTTFVYISPENIKQEFDQDGSVSNNDSTNEFEQNDDNNESQGTYDDVFEDQIDIELHKLEDVKTGMLVHSYTISNL